MRANWAMASVAVLVGVGLAGGWWLGRVAGDSQAPAGMAAAMPAHRTCGPAVAGAAHPGMVWVPGGEFTMGKAGQYSEEGPATRAQVDGFWMDQTEVTNAQFAAFVAATGYRTLAERGVRLAADLPPFRGSTVFHPPPANAAPGSIVDWWQFVPGADWRHPDGPDSSIAGRDDYPVVHIAYEDALAYANWKGVSLPTEAQFEYAAQSSARRDVAGHWMANTWQGSFPVQDTGADGHAGAAPVACYPANQLGLHDLLGNVWEWTASPYFASHDTNERERHPRGFDPKQPDEPAVAVLKGGSFLCAPDYCMRYRPEARIAQGLDLGTSHIGFRTVLNPARTST